MSVTVDGPRRNYTAKVDLSAKQFFIVKLDTDETKVDLCAAATSFIIGTLCNAPKIGEVAEVAMRHGGATAKVKAGGSITAGADLTSDSAGKAVATTTPGDEVFGRALQAADTNDVFEYEPCNRKFVTVN
jgi:hypothetical protein